MRNVFAAVVVLLLLAGGALAALRAYSAHKADEGYQATKASQDAEARRLMPRFLAYEDSLRKDPFFTETRPDKDAGAYLNARVQWSPAAPAAAGAPRLIGSDITPELEKQLASWDKAWPTHGADVDFSKLDLSWFGELHAFGTWDLTTPPSPILTHMEGGWAEMPVPHFIGLQRASKLRLMQGIATEKPLEAARDVRQLAWLCYRTETVIGGAIAVALLTIEQRAQEAWLEAGHPPVEGWTPMPASMITRFKAVVMAGMPLGSALVDAKVYEEAYGAPGLHVGQCAALTERAGIMALLRSVPGGESSEFFRSLPTYLGPVEGCNLHLAKVLWEKHLPPLSASAAGGGSSDLDGLTARLAPTDAIIKIMLGIAAPAGFGALAAPDGGAP